MGVTIRAATHTDEASLFALASVFPTPTPPGVEIFREILQVKLTDPRSAILVAESGGRLVGYLSGLCHVAFHSAGARAWVDEIFVVPEHRATGIGKQLMAGFETWAMGRVRVGCAGDCGSCFVYERLGYSSKAGYFKKYPGTAPL